MTGVTLHRLIRDELVGIEPIPESALATALDAALELEALADEPTMRPGDGFIDRVWASLAGEPTPAPSVAARQAIRQRSLPRLVRAVSDARIVAIGRGRPWQARKQAMAVLLAVALLALGTVGAGAAGGIALLAPYRTQPAPVSTAPAATHSPEASPTAGSSDAVEPPPTEAPQASSGSTPTSRLESAPPTPPSATSSFDDDERAGASESPESGASFEPDGSPGPTDGWWRGGS